MNHVPSKHTIYYRIIGANIVLMTNCMRTELVRLNKQGLLTPNPKSSEYFELMSVKCQMGKQLT